MANDLLKNYLPLLAIRRAARRRDTLITGGIFLASFITLIALGMLDRINGRAIYLAAGMVAAFGAGYWVSWVKLQIIDAKLEIIENLQGGEGSLEA